MQATSIYHTFWGGCSTEESRNLQLGLVLRRWFGTLGLTTWRIKALGYGNDGPFDTQETKAWMRKVSYE